MLLLPRPLYPQCQIIYPRQQLLTLRELEMIGFIENNVSKLSLLLSEISRCVLTSLFLFKTFFGI